MTDIPWIVSLDDHIVEPPDLWSSRLPAKYQDVGPRIVLAPPGTPVLVGGGYREAPGTEGDPVAWWFYEDLQYSVKRLIAAAGYPPTRSASTASPTTRCVPVAGSRRRASTT